MDNHKPVKIKRYRVYIGKHLKLTTTIEQLAIDVFKECLALSQCRNRGTLNGGYASKDVTLTYGNETIASNKDC